LTNEDKENELWSLIITKFKPNVIYYAHNLIFDITLFIIPLLKSKIKVNWIFFDFKLFELKIYLNEEKILILKCSHKLIPFSLKNFFPHFCSFQKINFPYEILEN
jgi:hypothetical protein